MSDTGVPATGVAATQETSSGSGLLRNNLVVAAGTALSRVTGLARFIVFAAVIGRDALGDAYLLANETPNIIYDTPKDPRQTFQQSHSTSLNVSTAKGYVDCRLPCGHLRQAGPDTLARG